MTTDPTVYHLMDAEVNPAASDTSDGSDTGLTEAEAEIESLLAGVRDGSWLDRQNLPALRYAVSGLLPEGATLLIGPPKAGKSWLVLGLLLAVAGDGKALGTIATGEAQRVLYLAMEDGDRRMQDRCRALLGDETIPERFHYLTTVTPSEVPLVIEAFVKRYPDTAMVVVDTLGKVMPPALPGESAYGRDYRVMSRLKQIADGHSGVALVVLHHDRKATSEDFIDSVSGTHGLAGAADTIIVLARKRQATVALLKVTGRDVPEAEYAVVVQPGGTWTLDGDSLDAAAKNAEERAESAGLGDRSLDVLHFVRQHPGGVQAKQVATKFGPDAHQYLKRLTDAGRLTKPKRGLYLVPTPVSEPSEVSEDDADPPPAPAGPPGR